MSDFCLRPQAITDIARQAGLMDRMVHRYRPVQHGSKRRSGPLVRSTPQMHWLRVSQQCMRFLASPRPAGQTQVPSFCANRTFFGDLAQRVSNLELGGAK